MKKGVSIRTDSSIFNDIDSFWLLCSMPSLGPWKDKFLESDTKKSGFINVSSQINRDPTNTASISFTRSFATNADNTMNLQGDTNYLIHMSWAVFDNEESYQGGSNIVLGD